MKKCFTINCMRTKADFIEYEKLINEGLFQGVELFFPYNVSLEQREIYTNEVTNLLSLHNVEVVLHLPHGGLNNLVNNDYSINQEIVQRMKDASDYANRFNAKKLTLHLGRAFNECDRQKLLNKIVDVLQDLCDYVSKYQMNVMIENMPGVSELGYSPDEIKDLITKTNRKNLKFILDTGHAHVSKYPILEYIYKLSDDLYHIHFSDNDGSCDQHKPINQGNIDFTKVFLALKDVKFNQLHCLEIIFKTADDLKKYNCDIEKYNLY